MTEKQLKGCILKLFKYKSISDKQFANACNNLEQLKDNDPMFYNLNMGRLYTSFGDWNVAIPYLEKASEIDDNRAIIFYNLYKCYVKGGNIEKAWQALNKFCDTNKSAVNFYLPAQALRRLKLMDDEFSDYLAFSMNVNMSTLLGFNDLKNDEQLLNLYAEVIDAFNKRNYSLCLEKLQLMDSRIIAVNYPMEVGTLISLVKMLKEKEIVGYTKMLDDDSVDLSDNGYCDVQLKLLNLGKYSPENFLRIIEENIVSGNMWIGTALLHCVLSMPKFHKFQDMIDYLKGCIREKEMFLQLNNDEQDAFESLRKKARNLYKKKANEEALDEYSKAKEMFGLAVCDYYIGKIFFRQGKFNQAREMFLSYLEQGGFKAEKALMFLGQIERIQKNDSLSKKYLKKMQRIHTVFDREYFYNFYRYNKKKNRNTFVEKKHYCDEIKMSLSDFTSIEPVALEDFYDVDVDGKLSIIRGLLMNGNDKMANKLFEEVQKECEPSDKAKLMQFVRNKKIYNNQNRTS